MSSTSPPRVLGVGGVAFAMFNCIVGASIFKLPAEVAATLGAAAVLAYLLCCLVFALVALCLAEVGSRVVASGGLYASAAIAFGPVVGGVVGTLVWISYVSGAAAVANVWAETLALMWPPLAGGGARALLILAAYAALAALNVHGARQGSRLSVAMALAKLVPLIGVALIGIAALQPANLRWAQLPSATAVGGASMSLFFAFGGIEYGLTASGEVREPARTIPRAILLASLLVAGLYLSLQMAAQGVLGAALPRSPAPLVSIAAVLLGPRGAQAMLIATFLSTFGYVVADVLCSPRSLYALAERGQLPRLLAVLSPRSGTPALAICVYSALCVVLTISGSFRTLVRFSVTMTLLIYLISCLGLLRLRAMKIEQAGAPFVAPGGALVPLLAAALIGALLSSLSRVELLGTSVPVALSAVAYWMKERGLRP